MRSAMSQTLESIQALVANNKPTDRSTGYPIALRRKVGRWLHEQNQAGQKWAQLAPKIGLSSTTVRNWAQPFSKKETTTSSFLPVLLQDDEENPAVEAPSIVFTSPNGFRVEGLQLQQIITLCQALG